MRTMSAIATVLAPATNTRARAHTPTRAPEAAPDWIVRHAQNKAQRRALAAAMRVLGVEPTGDTWERAKALLAQGESVESAALGASIELA